jgi:hypothetical protein
MKSKYAWCLAIFLLSSFVMLADARADQCSWNSEAISTAGARAIKAAGSTVSFCEPCSDAAYAPRQEGV